MSDFAQSVKQQADIVKVIESYIRLRNAGAHRFKGLCPFHEEKTPSFNVNGGSQQFFYCFGCHESGDVFSFVGKIENVTFPEAVRVVAQKCGIPLPKREFSSPEEAAEARMRAKLLDLHETAAAWFEEQLRGPEGAVAREYLASRGLSDEGIKKFRIGYAPDSFNALRDRLSGVADQETLRASGLFSSKEQGDGSQGPIYDRFRKRVVFPICNEGGRVIAFTARTLETGEKAGAKYINSPETPLYTKGQVLFNLDKAKSAIRQTEAVVLVEGQMDCIRVFLGDQNEPGVPNVVATSGTAFTENQVSLLKRQFSKDQPARAFVVFDGDAAGETAKEKSIDILGPLMGIETLGVLLSSNFKIYVITLEGGLDPDRFIRERGMKAFKDSIREARLYKDFLFERARKLYPGNSSDQKIKAMNYLLRYTSLMSEVVERDLFAADISQKLGIDSAVLREELRQAALKRRGRVEQRPAALTEVERVLLRALANTEIEYAAARQVASKAVQEQPSWFEHLASFGAMQALAVRGAKDPMDVVEDPGQKALLAEALLGESRPPADGEVESALQEVEERALEARLRDLRAQIADAERRGDQVGLALLTQQKLELDRALRQLQNRKRPEQ